jgi:hypothetical protein
MTQIAQEQRNDTRIQARPVIDCGGFSRYRHYPACVGLSMRSAIRSLLDRTETLREGEKEKWDAT